MTGWRHILEKNFILVLVELSGKGPSKCQGEKKRENSSRSGEVMGLVERKLGRGIAFGTNN